MSLFDRAKALGATALNTVTDVGGDLMDRAAKIDLSGVTETVAGGFRAAVDSTGKIVDAAGNRITHPADAFDEGVKAAQAGGDIENPYR